MEKKNCSLKEHCEIEAISYCKECNIYMCNKCEKIHSGLCQNHHTYKIDKNIKELFTGFCQEENHNCELEFFCKNHNILCCAKCIIKIACKGKGQHKDCEVCYIEDIKEEKKNKLKDNIQQLEEFLKTLEESINKLKIIFQKINENKEEVKLKIQKIFTKIRNEINNREDKLLLEVDEFLINKNIINENEKLPNKIRNSLEKGKNIDKEWNDENKLITLINDCINIENNLKNISIINQNIKKYSISNNIKIKFYPQNENEIDKFLGMIKSFGNISYNKYKFRKCPINIDIKRKYKIEGENENIIEKTDGQNYYSGTICEEELDKLKVNKWRIKILKTKSYDIRIGIASIDFDNNSPLTSKEKSGWYYSCYNGNLYAGPPHYLYGKETNLNMKL